MFLDKYRFLINKFPEKYELIKNEKDLYLEGEYQHNCVYSYLNDIKEGYCIIYKYIENSNHYTIEIGIEDERYKLFQVKNTYNIEPGEDIYNMLNNDLNIVNQEYIKEYL